MSGLSITYNNQILHDITQILVSTHRSICTQQDLESGLTSASTPSEAEKWREISMVTIDLGISNVINSRKWTIPNITTTMSGKDSQLYNLYIALCHWFFVTLWQITVFSSNGLDKQSSWSIFSTLGTIKKCGCLVWMGEGMNDLRHGKKSFPVSIQVTFSRGSVKSLGLGVHTAPNTGFTYERDQAAGPWWARWFHPETFGVDFHPVKVTKIRGQKWPEITKQITIEISRLRFPAFRNAHTDFRENISCWFMLGLGYRRVFVG